MLMDSLKIGITTQHINKKQTLKTWYSHDKTTVSYVSSVIGVI